MVSPNTSSRRKQANDFRDGTESIEKQIKGLRISSNVVLRLISIQFKLCRLGRKFVKLNKSIHQARIITDDDRTWALEFASCCITHAVDLEEIENKFVEPSKSL